MLLNPETKELADYLNESKGLISNSVYALKRNKANDIFIGTEGTGINILNAATGRLEKLEIPDKYPPFKAVYNIILRIMISFMDRYIRVWLNQNKYFQRTRSLPR